MPVVVWIHGGGWGWRGVKGAYLEIMNVPLDARGYFAVGVEYRLSTEASLEDMHTSISFFFDDARGFVR